MPHPDSEDEKVDDFYTAPASRESLFVSWKRGLSASRVFKAVVAIDFGTTRSAVLIALKKKGSEEPTVFTPDWSQEGVGMDVAEDYSVKTNCSLLLDKKAQFVAFGETARYLAQRTYSKAYSDTRDDYWLFFEHFKMALHKSKDPATARIWLSEKQHNLSDFAGCTFWLSESAQGSVPEKENILRKTRTAQPTTTVIRYDVDTYVSDRCWLAVSLLVFVAGVVIAILWDYHTVGYLFGLSVFCCFAAAATLLHRVCVMYFVERTIAFLEVDHSRKELVIARGSGSRRIVEDLRDVAVNWRTVARCGVCDCKEVSVGSQWWLRKRQRADTHVSAALQYLLDQVCDKSFESAPTELR